MGTLIRNVYVVLLLMVDLVNFQHPDSLLKLNGIGQHLQFMHLWTPFEASLNGKPSGAVLTLNVVFFRKVIAF